LPQDAFDFLGELDEAEVAGRIQIVLPGFIDHTKIFLSFGSLIGQDLIHLANDQVLAPFILEADGKPHRRSVLHRLNPETV
jgi:hypothetical protein